MTETAISCDGLSKLYRIGTLEYYKTLRDVLSDAAASPFRRLRHTFSRNGNGNSKARIHDANAGMIWAVKDVSLEINRGEVVGLIGRNGAGKSTLLRILARITKPTHGHAQINGRVGSLLEVGTGFHPELTGRENIYLNGAILGMRKREIARKFDEIVAFAEVEQFIDTPVKRYSSGMYVRLAFAVAAHLDTEVLFVDEVLAVGDAQFQKKCFAKIREGGRDGKTILVVSHNLATVRSICGKGIQLQNGRITRHGEIHEVIDGYLADLADQEVDNACETSSFLLETVIVRPIESRVIKTFETCEILVTFEAKVDIGDPGLYVGVLTREGHRVAGLDFKDFASLSVMKKGERVEAGFIINSLPFLPGRYQLEIHLKDMSKHLVEFVPRNYQFEVVETPVYGGRKLDRWFGNVAVNAKAVASAPFVAGSAAANRNTSC